MDDHFRFPPLPPLESSLIWNQMMSQENPLGNSQIPSSFSHPMNNHLPLRGQSFYFKTKICVRFKSGCCPNGDSCNFAHTFEELRPLGNGAANRDWLPRQDYCYSSCRQNPDMSNCDVWINQSEEQKLFKNKICRKFYAGGICPYGDKCSFLHVEPGSLQDSSGDHNVSSSSRQNHVHWKTKLCHKWSTSGKCPYGGQCNHAHGDAELRKSGLKNHCEEDEKRVAAAPSKVSSCGRTDDALPKVKKPHPISLPQPPAPITTLTLEKCKRIYGDWIDD